MIFEFRLPIVSPHMSVALVECVYSTAGSVLKTGDKLLDLRVDLTSSFAQDCPPISYYRIIMRENAVLRAFHLGAGASCKPGDLIAVFSTSGEEAMDQPPQRPIRFATAGIVHHPATWTGNEQQ
jgi:pyruvate/2-oxoglutarate dehydrogenase complex dihydrolipoamide acyltransferase (E2) component